MARCPWYNDCKCKKAGKFISDICDYDYHGFGWSVDICRGAQRNGKKYTDCMYYEKVGRHATGNERPCPCCNRVETSREFLAYCCSEKNPEYRGGRGTLVTNDNIAPICIGMKINGKSYTSCPFYIRGGKKKTDNKKRLPKNVSNSNKTPTRPKSYNGKRKNSSNVRKKEYSIKSTLKSWGIMILLFYLAYLYGKMTGAF